MLSNQIKIYITLSLFLLVSRCLFSQKATDDFSGKWKVEEGKIVEITKLNGIHNGIGIPENVHVLKDVKFRNGKWEGIIHNPLNKKEAQCEVQLEGADKLKIIAKIGKYRKVFLWTRVK